MNWGTIVAGLLTDMGRPPSDSDKVKRCVVNAIRQHADEHFWFNELSFNFTTTINVSAYDEATSGFPKGLVSIQGELLFLDLAGVATQRYPLYRRTQEFIESCRAGVGYVAQPEQFAYYAKRLELYPTPDTSTHIIRGRAVVDQWSPIVRYESSVWKFYKPLTTSFVVGNEMVDAYPTGGDTNPWLTDADDMIALYAQYLFWSQMAQATDGQDQRAQMAYVAALASHQEKTSALLGPFQIEPYPIGAGY